MDNPTLASLAQRLLDEPPHALSSEERHVLSRIYCRLPLRRNAADVTNERATFGEYLADRVAAVCGSSGFIIAFGVVLVCWLLLNADVLARWHSVFDPYPYVFLHLMLSMVAAIQAPVIIMSQNCQSTKDRVAARSGFEVNLRAELAILRLHDKIDFAVAQRLGDIIVRQERLWITLKGPTIQKPAS